ncbi:hypothetical protein AM500_14005 [Bacillus sp. FJAT-18017]|jgi:hypothetical protein|uniref:hypothetical protein n=1 Tax=unclassified Bacillus (in: firmicutes) TaxID=185979 RepID=UPI0005C7A4DF|nr:MULTISPECIES: hypothetical protein [unclassified Bacillus (in: firmicutes)]ALC90777.1 hypothetical protein AM500_14005 [Bacillus sp. FJAT-18017]
MICFCEELDREKYGITDKIVILEGKETILNVYGLKSGHYLELAGIDTRLLTMFYKSLIPGVDWFIVVYDYKQFCSDAEMKEAIIWHELGHIEHPVEKNQHNVESEIRCDELAIKRGYKEGIKKVLDLTHSMARTLNNQLLADMTTQRLMRMSG